ncbi:MAG: metallophosphoesterase [Clostridia bacterium]|nr:metallophosphoesterase [Clostridia bacterium]
MILQRNIQIKEYTVPMPGLDSGSRITLCHISDVHSDAFGDYSAQAVEAVACRNPDAILFTGDMIDCRRDEDGAFFFRLLDRLPEVPVVASPGNHEKRIERAWGTRWHFVDDCKARGMQYLDNDHVRLTLQGQKVDFYGYIQPFKIFTKRGKKRARLVQEIAPEEITATLGACPQGAVVLLAHDPVLLDSYAAWGAPLVLSGHIHGGVVKVPGIGGLLSPARKFFPPYDDGMYERGRTKMIVSRGLCAPMFPRINNAPDVAFITLTGEEG